MWSRDSSVGITTRYGLEGLGIESRWGEIFRTYPDRLRGPPGLLYKGYGVFPGSKVRPGRDADHTPPSSAEVKNRAIPLLSLRAFVAYERVKPAYINAQFLNLKAANTYNTQAWTGPEGSRRLRLPEFQDNRRMKAVRLSALHTSRLYPHHPSQEIFLVRIFVGAGIAQSV
jgi:hypothetical protein